MDKLSYSWGLLMGSQLKGMGVKELDSADFKNGVTAAFNGEEPRISIEEAQKLINGYLGELQQKAEKLAREAGEKFLAGNRSKENVKETPSGAAFFGQGLPAFHGDFLLSGNGCRGGHCPPAKTGRRTFVHITSHIEYNVIQCMSRFLLYIVLQC